MEISRYLAMTPGEWENSTLPEGYRAAWMACHFSPYGTGLINLPEHLPPESLLILNDRTPIHRHDPGRITEQLSQAVEVFRCAGVLLDLQRPEEPETAQLCRHLARSLSCPLGVSEAYGQELDCALFLSPVPPDQPLDAHLSPWQGREIWLDGAIGVLSLEMTEAGCEAAALPWEPVPENAFCDEVLHCRYRTEILENRLRFTLWRDKAQLEKLLKEAENLGVTKAIGLLQEWRTDPTTHFAHSG